jgi:hypothetical protein
MLYPDALARVSEEPTEAQHHVLGWAMRNPGGAGGAA